MPILILQPDESASKDTLISATVPNGNYGTNATLPAGVATTHYKSLLAFDLSSILAGAVVITATLRLWCESEQSTTDRNIFIHRSLVEWFEGDHGSGGAPSGDGSTWNYRNSAGSVAWAGGAGTGGVAGNDYATTPTDTVLITSASAYHNFDVTADVQLFIDELAPNYGWWLVGDTAIPTGRKVFSSSTNATAALRPELTVEYEFLLFSDIENGSSVTGSLSATGSLASNLSGQASVTPEISSNQIINSSIQGSSVLSATGELDGQIRSTILASGSVSGTLTAKGYASAAFSSLGIVAGDIKGVDEISGSIFGSSTTSAIADFAGKLRSSFGGTASVSGLMWGKATGKVVEAICDPTPLLYLTDGTIKTNGQKNLLNFLSKEAGFLLRDWRPQIAQYKEGGRFSNGPLSQGRRLRYRNFENIIDVYELSASGHNQDALIEYQQELMAFQEAAADYWVSDYVSNPVYLVAKAARETHERYAIVHMISVPELTNPYVQPFYGRGHSVVETLTIRIEHGHWLSTAPGNFESVEISSIRSWTVSGWQIGS